MDPEAERHAMVDRLVDQGVLRDPAVEAALRAIPRHLFLPEGEGADPHEDAPQPIGSGQTLSAPHMVAMMAQALAVKPGHRVLEVGGGSGYHAAVLAWLARPGRVVCVEVVPALAEQARWTLARLPEPLPVDVVLADGSLGHPTRAPYSRISVACAAPAVPPPLLDQLAPGGILVIPVGPLHQQGLLRVWKRADGTLLQEVLGPVRFVPLVGRFGFPG